jgi:hypothetical protein
MAAISQQGKRLGQKNNPLGTEKESSCGTKGTLLRHNAQNFFK